MEIIDHSMQSAVWSSQQFCGLKEIVIYRLDACDLSPQHLGERSTQNDEDVK